MKKIFSYAPNPFKKMPKGVKKLAVVNAVLVVNRDKNGKKISNKEFLKRVKETGDIFLSLFGGYTNDEINEGRFRSKINNKTMKEKVARIVCYSNPKDFKKNRAKLEKWLLDKKKEWNQETIAYEFEGDLYYI
jgi:hypothetical protein